MSDETTFTDADVKRMLALLERTLKDAEATLDDSIAQAITNDSLRDAGPIAVGFAPSSLLLTLGMLRGMRSAVAHWAGRIYAPRIPGSAPEERHVLYPDDGWTQVSIRGDTASEIQTRQ